MKFATYNIHAAIGTDGRYAPERIATVLQQLDADVVALQEIEHRRVDHQDMLDYFAAQTGLTAIEGPTLQRESHHYGNALLTRLPIASIDRIDLSVGSHEPRGAINVVHDYNRTQIRVIATHLGLSPGERRQQVRRLLVLLETHSADISILMGDLNEWFLWGRILRWLRAHFKATPNYPTFPSRYPVFALDHLWVNPRQRLTKLEVHNTPLARSASDHLPLLAVVDV